MPVSKRTRYEVLRRDGHKCRYCGLRATEAELTVDHVLPVALGGTDDPGNLVAACKDCNAGKASTGPDAPMVADVDADARRWALAVKAASTRMLANYDQRSAYVDTFLTEWVVYDEKHHWLPRDFESSVIRWCDQGLPSPVLVEAVGIAMCKRIPLSKVFPYMCGIVRNRLAELTADARAEFDAGATDEATRPDETADWTRAASYWQYADDGYRLLASHIEGHPGATFTPEGLGECRVLAGGPVFGEGPA